MAFSMAPPLDPMKVANGHAHDDDTRQERDAGTKPALRKQCSLRKHGPAHLPCVTEAEVKEDKVLHPDLLNEAVLEAQYAVRGELYLKGEELRKQGQDIIFTNVGNPHSLGAKPITFIRQVVALVSAPFLLDNPKVGELFPADAVARAKWLLTGFKGGVGAYTDSRGSPLIREEVANFIQERDGYPANAEHIFMADGASAAVKMCLGVMIRGPQDGILVPIPQYPLYSASITLYGGTLIPYMLDEDNGWALNVKELKKMVDMARDEGVNVRGLAFINPGNPTGQTLSEKNLEELVHFACEENIVLMADEVYQELIYDESTPFVSGKKALMDAGEPYSSKLELFSFHTISKGTIGECGLRGGYVEMVNIHPGTIKQFYKLASINLCPNSLGQVAMSCMVHPPDKDGESYELYMKERKAEFESLKRRACLVGKAFSEVENMSCTNTQGAMYSFPKICLPAKAKDAAEAAGKAPDVFYCLKLLEKTGISTVPGSGFGQKEGTHHFRTTILPREEVMEAFVDKFVSFHQDFMHQYA